MPLRYHLRRLRPPSINMRELIGEKVLSGDIYLSLKRNSYMAMSRLTISPKEILAYYAPTAKYYMNKENIPSFKYSDLNSIVIIERVSSGECLLAYLDKDFHFSMFIRWSHDENEANCTLNDISQIVSLRNISPGQELICYCDQNVWQRIDPMTIGNVQKAQPMLAAKTVPPMNWAFHLADTFDFKLI